MMWILGWVLCSVCAYLVWRRGWKKSFGEWTTGDRGIALVISLAGPVGLIAVTVTVWVCRLLEEGDRPAKW